MMEAEDKSSTTGSSRTTAPNAFWPLAILTAAILILMIMQLWNLWSQRGALQQNFQARRAALVQTQELQQRVNGITQELLILSQSNADAKAIVQKYKIEMAQPAPPPQNQ
jgi:hypothetical protein